MVLVCDLIRGRREGLGLTQVDLAELIGVSRNSIGRWESGRGTGKRNEGGPTAPNRKKLAFVLGGEPSDYEWSEADRENADHLTRLQVGFNAAMRDLLKRFEEQGFPALEGRG